VKPAPSEQKLRGGYYTPPEVAAFLAKWAIRSESDTVFEPSCGDGAFLEAAVSALRSRRAASDAIAMQVEAIEYDAKEAREARVRLQKLGVSNTKVLTGDFFEWCRRYGARRFDAVVGNPPFIRYQHFPEDQREVAFALMRTLGLNPNGLTNAWVPFVCLATTLLSERGRLAMVIPSELLQVTYSAQLRRFLSDSFERITLFTFQDLLFKEAQQEVVLLCGERQSEKTRGIEVVEMRNAADLAPYAHSMRGARSAVQKQCKPMDHTAEKWTQYFLSRREISLLRAMRAHSSLTTVGKVASVDVGVVTGLNEFFVLTESDRAQRALTDLTTPVVTRSAHLTGIMFDKRAFQSQVSQNARAHLLNLPSAKLDNLPASARSYIREGERKGFNQGYKCRTRNPWWVVPSAWSPDGFMLRQIHTHPKIAVNESGATCTDTIHRVRLLNGIGAKTLASAFTNSLTFAFSEVLGRSYGGGVLELEPTEAEKLPIPLTGAENLDFSEINGLLVRDRLEDALTLVDETLLQRNLGLSASEIRMLRGIWRKLMERRRRRKRQAASRISSE
jgi:adenine-specific DNA-methyltransferase